MIDKKILSLAAVAVLVLAALFLLLPQKQSASNPQVPADAAVLVDENTFTLADVGKHNTETDCWLAIGGKVYDVTSFIASGKHGPAIKQGCGKDGSELYETRPMGSGTPHSDTARSILANYYIGDLA
jgi:cytochrome b involved in lipid metabolism